MNLIGWELKQSLSALSSLVVPAILPDMCASVPIAIIYMAIGKKMQLRTNLIYSIVIQKISHILFKDFDSCDLLLHKAVVCVRVHVCVCVCVAYLLTLFGITQNIS